MLYFNMDVYDLLLLLYISDPMPQMPKASSSAVEAEQSLDEILGLQVLQKGSKH